MSADTKRTWWRCKQDDAAVAGLRWRRRIDWVVADERGCGVDKQMEGCQLSQQGGEAPRCRCFCTSLLVCLWACCLFSLVVFHFLLLREALMETRHNCSNQSLPLLPLLSVSPRVVSPSPPSLSPPSLTSLVEQLMMHLLLLLVVIVQQQLKLKNFLNSWRFGPFFGGYDNIHIPLNYICISFDGAFFAFEHLPLSIKKKEKYKNSTSWICWRTDCWEMWQSTSAGRGGHIWWTWGLRGFREEVTDGGGEMNSSTCSFLGERRKSWELQKKRERGKTLCWPSTSTRQLVTSRETLWELNSMGLNEACRPTGLIGSNQDRTIPLVKLKHLKVNNKTNLILLNDAHEIC